MSICWWCWVGGLHLLHSLEPKPAELACPSVWGALSYCVIVTMAEEAEMGPWALTKLSGLLALEGELTSAPIL